LYRPHRLPLLVGRLAPSLLVNRYTDVEYIVNSHAHLHCVVCWNPKAPPHRTAAACCQIAVTATRRHARAEWYDTGCLLRGTAHDSPTGGSSRAQQAALTQVPASNPTQRSHIEANEMRCDEWAVHAGSLSSDSTSLAAQSACTREHIPHQSHCVVTTRVPHNVTGGWGQGWVQAPASQQLTPHTTQQLRAHITWQKLTFIRLLDNPTWCHDAWCRSRHVHKGSPTRSPTPTPGGRFAGAARPHVASAAGGHTACTPHKGSALPAGATDASGPKLLHPHCPWGMSACRLQLWRAAHPHHCHTQEP
jgi:hypothetical protein